MWDGMLLSVGGGRVVVDEYFHGIISFVGSMNVHQAHCQITV